MDLYRLLVEMLDVPLIGMDLILHSNEKYICTLLWKFKDLR